MKTVRVVEVCLSELIGKKIDRVRGVEAGSKNITLFTGSGQQYFLSGSVSMEDDVKPWTPRVRHIPG